MRCITALHLVERAPGWRARPRRLERDTIPAPRRRTYERETKARGSPSTPSQNGGEPDWQTQQETKVEYADATTQNRVTETQATPVAYRATGQRPQGRRNQVKSFAPTPHGGGNSGPDATYPFRKTQERTRGQSADYPNPDATSPSDEAKFYDCHCKYFYACHGAHPRPHH